MLQDGAGLVLLDTFWHHVQDVMHHSRSQLQVKVRLDSLLCHLHIDPNKWARAIQIVLHWVRKLIARFDNSTCRVCDLATASVPADVSSGCQVLLQRTLQAPSRLCSLIFHLQTAVLSSPCSNNQPIMYVAGQVS